MRYITILLILSLIGCDERSGERRERRRRGDEIVNPRPTPEPIESGNIEKAQRAQATSRAAAMRELAESTRNGTAKTVWDVNKQFKASDQIGRDAFEQVFGKEMERALSSPNSDNLPSNAVESFEKFAKEFDNAAK